MVLYSTLTVGNNKNTVLTTQTNTSDFTGSFFNTTNQHHSGLRAIYSFDDANVVQVDTSLYINNGSLTGSYGLANGKIGSALTFTSSGSGLLTIPNSESLNLTGSQLTLAAWFNANSIYASRFITKNPLATTPFAQYELGTTIAAKIFFRVSSGNTVTTILSGSPAYTTGSWFRAVGIFDVDAAGSQLKLYINNVLDVKASSTITVIGSRDGTVYVGGDVVNGSQAYFNGTLDDVRVCNYAWNTTEISNDFNNGSGQDVSLNRVRLAPDNENRNFATTGSYLVTIDFSGTTSLRKDYRSFIWNKTGTGPISLDYRFSNDASTWTNYVNDTTGSLNLRLQFYRYAQLRFNLSGNGVAE